MGERNAESKSHRTGNVPVILGFNHFSAGQSHKFTGLEVDLVTKHIPAIDGNIDFPVGLLKVKLIRRSARAVKVDATAIRDQGIQTINKVSAETDSARFRREFLKIKFKRVQIKIIVTRVEHPHIIGSRGCSCVLRAVGVQAVRGVNKTAHIDVFERLDHSAFG